APASALTPRDVCARPAQSAVLFPYTTLFRSLTTTLPQLCSGLFCASDTVGRSSVCGTLGKPARSNNRCAATLSPAIDDATESFKDRKSTRLNSSHVKISYAAFCLKKQSTSRR